MTDLLQSFMEAGAKDAKGGSVGQVGKLEVKFGVYTSGSGINFETQTKSVVWVKEFSKDGINDTKAEAKQVASKMGLDGFQKLAIFLEMEESTVMPEGKKMVQRVDFAWDEARDLINHGFMCIGFQPGDKPFWGHVIWRAVPADFGDKPFRNVPVPVAKFGSKAEAVKYFAQLESGEITPDSIADKMGLPTYNTSDATEGEKTAVSITLSQTAQNSKITAADLLKSASDIADMMKAQLAEGLSPDDARKVVAEQIGVEASDIEQLEAATNPV